MWTGLDNFAKWADKKGIPSGGFGINSAGGTWHSIGNSGDIYHNQLRGNSTEAIIGRTTVTFNGEITQDGANFVNNLGVSRDNVNVAQANGGSLDVIGATTTLLSEAASSTPEGHVYYMPRSNRVQMYSRRYVNPSMKPLGKTVGLKFKAIPILALVNQGSMYYDYSNGDMTKSQFKYGTMNNVASTVVPQYGVALMINNVNEWFWNLPVVKTFLGDLEYSAEQFWNANTQYP
jgi:hypothetical protein